MAKTIPTNIFCYCKNYVGITNTIMDNSFSGVRQCLFWVLACVNSSPVPRP